MFGGVIMTFMFIIALFLILLVLVQRGRGGGLTGALGGMGGQSAFGTKAGDLFTRITIGAAAVWILLCIFAVKYFNDDNGFNTGAGGTLPAAKTPLDAPAGETGGKSAAPTGSSTESAPASSAPATSESSAPATTPASSDQP